MGVEDVCLAISRQLLDSGLQRFDFTQFAKARQAVECTGYAVKRKPVDGFNRRPIGAMAGPGNANHLDPGTLQAFEYGACAKGIAAMQGQGVVEYMKDAGHKFSPCGTLRLTPRQLHCIMDRTGKNCT